MGWVGEEERIRTKTELGLSYCTVRVEHFVQGGISYTTDLKEVMIPTMVVCDPLSPRQRIFYNVIKYSS